MIDKTKVGFIRGVAYAASMMKKHEVDYHELINATGITYDEFKLCADESDLDVIEEVLT
ncbi:hypothetical protein [Virgibacillus pantothenticus]|uniref:hypothetical protein n=1 Tax=Virgibacillus pantothenticus TaxID=1473 RepID=UPI000954300C|nr:hypothetical protein [Virgibacillus pantothenticus]MED3739363.1 hypothetical protein [Virgibacillus pantothenticus]QTY15506.1 hypothetical protein KBP50_16680 [Virgibacillus pantothenticus]SIT16789.1 hypothetical protein SAMN05421787_12735 [Virgibacillus pantothenticus]